MGKDARHDHEDEATGAAPSVSYETGRGGGGGEGGPGATAAPTREQFGAYQAMYDFFNRELFGSELRRVLLNFSRMKHTLGFFAPGRWESDSAVTHEISLNPAYLSRPASSRVPAAIS